jgi:biotin carboxylase
MFKTYNKNNQALLLLKADEFLRDRAIIAALRSFDGMIIGMNKEPAKQPNRFFDYVIDADPHNSEESLKAVKKFILNTDIVFKAIIPITEMTMTSALNIANFLQLPFLKETSVDAVRDKNLMKIALNKSNIPTPKHYVINNLNELKQVCNNIGLPVIIKPLSAAHSIGIKLIREYYEIEEIYNYCVESLNSVADSWGLKNLLFQVEEFIDSTKEISIEIINYKEERKVIAITDKSLSPLPFFTETGHMVPSIENNNMHIKDIALKACKALDLDYGVAHVEIRLDKNNNPIVIEVAARPGGDGIMDLVERVHGINMYELHIKSYLNLLNHLDDIKIQNYGTASMSFFPKKLGTINKIDTTINLPTEIVSLYISLKEGDIITESENYDMRLGTIECFWNYNSKELVGEHLKIAEKLRDKIFTIN